uniref:Uncharacterized protein n=1 Tax=viral metagenome TaxID=1070528 RepID=A0A6M3XT95_9ZZZZ
MPKEAVVETPVVKDAVPPEETPPEKTDEKPPEPPPEHPRFKEIYGKMKTFERQLADKDADIEALREHNKKLDDSISGVKDKISIAERPDPLDNPKEYDKWMIEQAVRAIEKKAKPEPVPQTTGKPTEKILAQIEAMSDAHDDYDEMAALAEEDWKNDPVLKREIFSSANPPKTAYNYGKKKAAGKKTERDKNIDKSYVEPGGDPPGKPTEGKPTPEQKRVAKALGVPIDKYMEQVKHIAKSRGGE